MRHLLTPRPGCRRWRRFKALWAGGGRQNYTRRSCSTRREGYARLRAGERFLQRRRLLPCSGMIIESASGQRYREVPGAALFTPLGMTSTSVLATEDPEAPRSRLQLRRRPARQHPADLAGGAAVALRRVSSVKDLLTWKRRPPPAASSSRPTLRTMGTPVRLNAAAPIRRLRLVRGRAARTHLDLPLRDHRHRAVRLPDDGVTVSVLTNGSRNRRQPRQLRGLTYGSRAVYRGAAGGPHAVRGPKPSRTAELRGVSTGLGRGEDTPALVRSSAGTSRPR